MLPLDTLLSFAIASLVLGLAPGPDNLFVLTQSALRGQRAGWLVTCGLCSGLIVHTIAVTFGVAAIFQTSALAFTILKGLGATYLLYLAWQAFRAGATKLDTPPTAQVSARHLYRRGVIMNITNPKVSIFFLAFLPQFADPQHGALEQQLLLLGGIFIIATILVFGLIALLAGQLGRWLQHSPSSQRWMNRLAGSVFATLALKLATAER